MHEEFKELLERIRKEGGYQDVEIDGKLLHKGWRGCEDRWKLIREYIGTGKAIIDIGSHYGYFANKLAKQGNVILSIEGGKERAEIQKEMLELNKARGVYLLNKTMNFSDWVDLMRTTEGIDYILALSVMHYTEPKELFDTLWVMSQISPNLIIEYPTLAEKTTASYEYVKGFGEFEIKLRCFYDEIYLLGNVISPSDPNLTRPVYLASNPKIQKNGVFGYLSHNRTGKRHNLAFNKGWKVDGKTDWTAGFNARTVLELGNLIYPNIELLKNSIIDEYFKLFEDNKFEITDVNYRNVILTNGDNLNKIIDFKEGVGKEIYGLTWEEYKNKLKLMSRQDWLDKLNEDFK